MSCIVTSLLLTLMLVFLQQLGYCSVCQSSPLCLVPKCLKSVPIFSVFGNDLVLDILHSVCPGRYPQVLQRHPHVEGHRGPFRHLSVDSMSAQTYLVATHAPGVCSLRSTVVASKQSFL